MANRIADGIVSGRQRINMTPFSDEFRKAVFGSPELLEFYGDYYKNLNEFFMTTLPQVPLVLVDNVTEYLFGEIEGWKYTDLPDVVVPPFPAVFIETKRIDGLSHPFDSWGALFTRMEESDFPPFIDLLPVPMDEVRWVVEMVLLTEKDHVIETLPWSFFFCFNNQGIIAGDEDGDFLYETREAVPDKFASLVNNDPMWQISKEQSLALALPFFFAFGFSHLKNVKVEPTPESRQARRQVERRGKEGKPVVRYHVLNIEPMKRILNTEGRCGEVGLKKALHIYRGHFKTYTEDSPLFGKYVGKWWWEANTRGSKNAGVVTKDYNVFPPSSD
jgi:hypothetical protein